MDYEKAYKDALERAREELGSGCFDRGTVEYIFPELEVSEDEKVKRGIIKFLKENKDFPEDWIAWLEKQGQSKKTSIWKHWKDGIAGNGEGKLIYLIKNSNIYSLSSCLSCECDYIELSELDNLMFEKQGEQKHAPKYNIGDTIYFNSFGKVKSMVVANIVDDGDGNPMYEDSEGNAVFEKCVIEQKPAWSEEDELVLTSTVNTLKLTNGDAQMKIEWLKSLKDRYTWKPNVEQLTAFAQHLNKRGGFRDDLCMDFEHEAQSFIESQKKGE